jgi:1,4-alpha-glucan branching enzyme
MLQDPLLMARYARRLDRASELAESEVHRTRSDPAFHSLAVFYRDRFQNLRRAFHDRYRGDLISAFRSLQDAGYLEIITCAASHAFLPALQERPEAVRAQIAVAIHEHQRQFGRRPSGIWLPECGYFPGLDQILAAEDLRYFFLDSHGVAEAQPPPIYGVFAPIYTPAGVAAFGRDPESSERVWSAQHGYPGDPVYREFYRDIGWDLEHAYIRPYVQPTGARKNTGIKYFRITGPTERKEPYHPDLARRRSIEHARQFAAERKRQIESLAKEMMGRRPIVTAPYDAELFGHWWFEGPEFLEALIREVANIGSYGWASGVEYLRDYPQNQLCQPPMSSWGENGYATTWLDETNDWIYRHLDQCAQRMVSLARDFFQANQLERRALNQAARELLLAQASDWAFIMKTGTMVEYAVRRTEEHVNRFLQLEAQLRTKRIERQWLLELEGRDNLFPGIDYRLYCPQLPLGLRRNNLKRDGGKS